MYLSNLAIKENVTVCGVLVPNISGGFGSDRKAMLATHIAEIHKKELKKVNELINNNLERFKNNVDIIDTKGTEFEVVLKDHGILTQNAINRSTNIYLLSERGYAKLIKLFNDDKSWEIYDQMLDEYFELRDGQSNSTPMTQAEMLVVYAQQFVEQERRLKQMEGKVTNIQTYLTQTPDRTKVDRKVKEYARTHHNRNVGQAYSIIYGIIKDKYGFDVPTRVKNLHERMNEERLANDKKPLRNPKLNGMDILERENMLGEVMEILAGLTSN
jgi:hypothetical protein